MQEKEAPPAAGEEVPLTSDVPPTVPDNLQTFSGTSRLNRNDMIRDMLTKGMLPNDVSGTATDPLPALLQGELSLRQTFTARKVWQCTTRHVKLHFVIRGTFLRGASDLGSP